MYRKALAIALVILITSLMVLPTGRADANQITQSITVYYGLITASNTYLLPVQIQVPSTQDIPRLAMEKLIEGPPKGSALSPLPFPWGSRVLSVKVSDGIAYVNLNEQASRAGVGSCGDVLLVGSIVNTLCECPGVRKVQILVEGRVCAAIWGHVDTSVPLDPIQNVVFRGFPDLKGHWAERDVLGLAIAKAFEGYPDGKVHPDRFVTRAEFVKILLGVRGVTPPPTTRQTFADVPREHWAHDALEAAVDLGFVRPSDYGDNFVPDRPLRRQEMAMILARAADLETRASKLKDAVLPYTDSTDLPGWARGYVAAVREAKLVTGYPDGTFRPCSAVSRAEAATVFMRMAGSTNDTLVVTYPRPGSVIDTDLVVLGAAKGVGVVRGRVLSKSRSTLGEAYAVPDAGISNWRVYGMLMQRKTTSAGAPLFLEVSPPEPGDGSNRGPVRVPVLAK